MCLGLKGFVWSPVPSAAAAVASTPKLSRIRTTAYAPIATTTTRSSGIHPFLNSRNTLCLLTCRSSRPNERRRPHAAPRSGPPSWAAPATELKFYVRRLLHLIARPEVGWGVHGRAHPSTSTHACAVTGTTVFDTPTAAAQPHRNRQPNAQRPTGGNSHPALNPATVH